MTHLVVMRFCTCKALKTPKLQRKRDPPSLTTPNSITWVCGAAKFTLKQVQRGGGGQVVTIYTIELLNADCFFSQW